MFFVCGVRPNTSPAGRRRTLEGRAAAPRTIRWYSPTSAGTIDGTNRYGADAIPRFAATSAVALRLRSRVAGFLADYGWRRRAGGPEGLSSATSGHRPQPQRITNQSGLPTPEGVGRLHLIDRRHNHQLAAIGSPPTCRPCGAASDPDRIGDVVTCDSSASTLRTAGSSALGSSEKPRSVDVAQPTAGVVTTTGHRDKPDDKIGRSPRVISPTSPAIKPSTRTSCPPAPHRRYWLCRQQVGADTVLGQQLTLAVRR